MSPDSSTDVTALPPLLRVVAGQPTAEELAALTAVVVALGDALQDSPAAARATPRSWVRGDHLRLSPRPGPGSWRRSSLR